MVAWFDSVILSWFQSIQNEFLTVLFKAITFLGEGGLIWIALGLCLIAYKKTRWVGISVLLALLFSLLVGNVTLKPLVARPRPCWRNPLVNLLIQNPKDYSFPSGHSLSSFAAAMAIFMNHRKMGVAALLFAFIMGCTRLYFYMLCGCQWSRKIDAFKNYSWCIEAGCRNYFVEWKSGGWNVSFGACRLCATGKSVI